MAKQQHFRDVTLDTAEKCLVISYSTDPGDGGELTHHKKRCVEPLARAQWTGPGRQASNRSHPQLTPHYPCAPAASASRPLTPTRT
jgi:hypothetical protein